MLNVGKCTVGDTSFLRNSPQLSFILSPLKELVGVGSEASAGTFFLVVPVILFKFACLCGSQFKIMQVN